MLPMLVNDFDPITYGFWRPLLRQLDEMLDQRVPTEPAAGFELDETDQHWVMSFDVPGVQREDLSVEVTGNRLLVSGERKADGRTGRRHGKFQRTFTLPDGVTADAVVAEHKDGVLRLAVRKPEAARPTKISIGDGAAQPRTGGFFKSLMGEKRAKDTLVVKGATAKGEPVALAN
jgi:HSP20 family protein